jgi:hypothetical protein
MKSFGKLFLLVILLFISCKKDVQRDEDGHIIVKGSNRLIVTLVHHSWAVTNVSVWLKNNATEFPGTDTMVYDWNTTSDLSGVAVFENLFPGNYFLYAKGFDATWGGEVHGYYPVVLNSTTITNNESYITLLVSE